jgi:SAM-dependent methyltransferase
MLEDPTMSETATQNREAAFHDAWANDTRLEDVLVRECFEAPTALENRFILDRIGDLRGKKVLDIGAGLGESSIYFALRGAQVTAVDLSPMMIEKIVALGVQYGVEVEGRVSNGEDLNVPADQFDVVYLANTIHHVQNRAALFEQMSRALKPGGFFFSYDPLAYNPVINIYRRMATRVRTPDEAPLKIQDLNLARKYFSNVGHREFWLSTLVLFVKYYLKDRVHPNSDRYWKRILRETPQSLRWWTPLSSLDGALTRIPGLRWLAWNVVMWGQKPQVSTNSSKDAADA